MIFSHALVPAELPRRNPPNGESILKLDGKGRLKTAHIQSVLVALATIHGIATTRDKSQMCIIGSDTIPVQVDDGTCHEHQKDGCSDDEYRPVCASFGHHEEDEDRQSGDPFDGEEDLKRQVLRSHRHPSRMILPEVR